VRCRSQISVCVEEQQARRRPQPPERGSAGVCESRIVAGFDHVRWLGGGTGAGKTTVAQRIAERWGVSVYGTDAAIRAHGPMLDPTTAPLLDRFRRMSMDQRWVLRDPVEMYRTFPWFHGAGFDLLIEDLRALPTDRITASKGFGCFPILSAHCSVRQAPRCG
jgi:hypothetical protein